MRGGAADASTDRRRRPPPWRLRAGCHSATGSWRSAAAAPGSRAGRGCSCEYRAPPGRTRSATCQLRAAMTPATRDNTTTTSTHRAQNKAHAGRGSASTRREWQRQGRRAPADWLSSAQRTARGSEGAPSASCMLQCTRLGPPIRGESPTFTSHQRTRPAAPRAFVPSGLYFVLFHLQNPIRVITITKGESGLGNENNITTAEDSMANKRFDFNEGRSFGTSDRYSTLRVEEQIVVM